MRHKKNIDNTFIEWYQSLHFLTQQGLRRWLYENWDSKIYVHPSRYNWATNYSSDWEVFWEIFWTDQSLLLYIVLQNIFYPLNLTIHKHRNGILVMYNDHIRRIFQVVAGLKSIQHILALTTTYIPEEAPFWHYWSCILSLFNITSLSLYVTILILQPMTRITTPKTPLFSSNTLAQKVLTTLWARWNSLVTWSTPLEIYSLMSFPSHPVETLWWSAIW